MSKKKPLGDLVEHLTPGAINAARNGDTISAKTTLCYLSHYLEADAKVPEILKEYLKECIENLDKYSNPARAFNLVGNPSRKKDTNYTRNFEIALEFHKRMCATKNPKISIIADDLSEIYHLDSSNIRKKYKDFLPDVLSMEECQQEAWDEFGS